VPEPSKYRGDRYSITLRKPVSEAVKKLAEEEDRPVAQMISVLIEEALEARKNTV